MTCKHLCDALLLIGVASKYTQTGYVNGLKYCTRCAVYIKNCAPWHCPCCGMALRGSQVISKLNWRRQKG